MTTTSTTTITTTTTTARVLLGSQSYPSVLRTGYFTSKRGAKNPMHPTPIGSPVINSGPFGRVGDFNQGGGWRGVLAGYPPTKACLLIKDKRGEPVMVIAILLVFLIKILLILLMLKMY